MRRPRLAPGFTAMVDGDSLWLIAGEDVRYRLRLEDPTWLRDLLARCDGTRSVDELATHADARSTIERLYEERVIVDGTAAQAHAPSAPGFHVVGDGPLADALRSDGEIEVLVQASLDHTALLAHNKHALAARRRWMWITTGPGGRAYVGPLFVPDAGPCAACLLVHFKRLSPVPELYDVVMKHAGPIAPSPFPDAAIATVAALARWKLGLVANPMAPALYALHVIDTAELTVTAHAPLADLECTECR